MNDQTYILKAYEFDGQGGATPLSGDDIARLVKDKALAWVHFDANHPQTREWIEKEITYLDPLILDALLAEETRPRATEYPDGFLVILRGVNLNEDAQEEDMVSVRLWIDANRIISTQKRQLRAVQTICDRLESGKGPKNSSDFLVALIERLLLNMEPAVLNLDDKTDDIEEIMLEKLDLECRKTLNILRKKAIILRRYIAPQKEAINILRTSDVPWMDEKHNRQLQENLDRITRYVEDLDSIRERGQVIKDELSTAISDQMNKNLYALSLIAALFLPLGFLTGLLGINVGGMPGVDSGEAFFIVCAVCCVILVIEYFIFRFLRWT